MAVSAEAGRGAVDAAAQDVEAPDAARDPTELERQQHGARGHVRRLGGRRVRRCPVLDHPGTIATRPVEVPSPRLPAGHRRSGLPDGHGSGHDGRVWPEDEETLVAVQQELGTAEPVPWMPAGEDTVTGGAWVCFPRGLTGPGERGDPVWAAAVAMRGDRVLDQRVELGHAEAAYRPGLMALRVGRLLAEVVRSLGTRPDVLFLDATARDHPRRAGLAWHLGAELDLPTVGVTHRPLAGDGEWPADERGATSPVRIGGTTVACWLRTRAGTRPLVVHPGWRVDLDTALALVRAATGRTRTPEPLRRARFVARTARNEHP